MSTPPPRASRTALPAEAALPAPAARRRTLAQDLALVAVLAAFVVVCTVVPAIPTPFDVPVTLQTFAVVLAGFVLGSRRGALAVLLYLALGLAGLPVFAQGASGLGALAGPSVGYLVTFPLLAAVAGLGRRAALRRLGAVPGLVLAGLAGTLLVNHPAGIAGLHARLGLGWREAAALDLTFLPGDVAKVVLAAVVAAAVLRAFPDLLPARRAAGAPGVEGAARP
ncbi:biotin transporter BioY [Cellulomonas marina]|uniref:Biotin transporter n=1 Tax=Cellulomonas marina TaxID=988821 RepID=A0A1I0ZSH2_9CELL|nr:biotin transporter BioY [Cellulomonas marina]GIG28799.1 hypothetical protein Cma02nite_13990 [Cellulomonas marina]SFB28461.1 biotin transport system substrate-specific component [Cellulomonas marina]